MPQLKIICTSVLIGNTLDFGRSVDQRYCSVSLFPLPRLTYFLGEVSCFDPPIYGGEYSTDEFFRQGATAAVDGTF